MLVSLVSLDDARAPALVAHIVRHTAESGTGGDPIFRPRPATVAIDREATADRLRAGWALALDQPHWLRTWGVVVDGEIRGHLDLQGGRLPAEAHRALLGMGVERAWRGRGHGRALLTEAIGWARRAGLAWLDLGVFAHNHRARALYIDLGFVEVGLTCDRFRVDGVAIDDVAMTLAL